MAQALAVNAFPARARDRHRPAKTRPTPEGFNRTYRHEVLDACVFESLRQVRQITRSWTN
jgi:hypothetical protein